MIIQFSIFTSDVKLDASMRSSRKCERKSEQQLKVPLKFGIEILATTTRQSIATIV